MVYANMQASKVIYPGETLGIIGEGPFGQDLVLKAKSMGFMVVVYSVSESNLMVKVADQSIIGDIRDADQVKRFAEQCKIVIYESGMVDFKTIQYISKYTFVPQKDNFLEICQDHDLKKTILNQNGVKTDQYVTITKLDEIYEELNNTGYPALLTPMVVESPINSESLLIKDTSDIARAVYFLDKGTHILKPLKESETFFSITIIKDQYARQKFFPMVKKVYRNGALLSATTPALEENDLQNDLLEQVLNIANQIDYIGTFSIDFYTENNVLVFKDLIPGIDSDGHQKAFELATNTSVEEVHLRATAGILVNDIKLKNAVILMNFNNKQLELLRTQWLIKDNWHFYFDDKWASDSNKNRAGYVLIEGDNLAELQNQIELSEIWQFLLDEQSSE